jgi:hypothetical protein
MAFTCEQIKEFNNPYLELKKRGALLEHREVLEKLSEDEMKELATKLIINCPAAKMNKIGREIESLNDHSQQEAKFYPVIYQAYEVKKRLVGLTDPLNEAPQNMFLDDEIDEEGFHDFNEMALDIVNDNKTEIATRLALTTPVNNQSKLARSVENLFNKSEFSNKISQALMVHRAIHHELLGQNPENFFSSRDFNPDLYREFSNLLSTLLKGQEQSIGEKLSILDAVTRNNIGRQLEQLTASANDKENSFKLINAAMNPKEEPKLRKEELANPIPELSPKKTFIENQGLFHRKASSCAENTESLLHLSSDIESESDDQASSCCVSIRKMFGC